MLIKVSKGTFLRHSTDPEPTAQPVWVSNLSNGFPGLSYVLALGEFLKGPVDESVIPARKSAREAGNRK
jgi:hypothetical protein